MNKIIKIFIYYNDFYKICIKTPIMHNNRTLFQKNCQGKIQFVYFYRISEKSLVIYF